MSVLEFEIYDYNDVQDKDKILDDVPGAIEFLKSDKGTKVKITWGPSAQKHLRAVRKAVQVENAGNKDFVKNMKYLFLYHLALARKEEIMKLKQDMKDLQVQVESATPMGEPLKARSAALLEPSKVSKVNASATTTQQSSKSNANTMTQPVSRANANVMTTQPAPKINASTTTSQASKMNASTSTPQASKANSYTMTTPQASEALINYDAIKAKLSDTEKALQESLSKLKTQGKDAEGSQSRIRELEHSVESLKSLEAGIKTKDAEISGLQVQISKMLEKQRKNAEQIKQVETLTQQLDEARKQLASARRGLEEANESISNLNKQVVNSKTQANAKLVSRDAKALEQDAEIARINEALQKANQDLADVNNNVRDNEELYKSALKSLISSVQALSTQ